MYGGGKGKRMESTGHNVSPTGAQCLVEGLMDSGVGAFFTNPGTSELHAVSAIDTSARARGILCLFEGVATGAADGYGRIAGKPGGVLLHLGPGLANGMANLHNARQAGTPMVVVVGEHGEVHLAYDSPLKSDLDSLPPFYSKHTWRLRAGDDIASVARASVASTLAPPTGIATIIAGADVMWSAAAAAHAGGTDPALRKIAVDPAHIQTAVEGLRSEQPTAVVLGRTALSEEGLKLAGAIARVTGATILSETFNARHTRGAGLPAIQRIPYFPELAVPFLSKFARLVLIGAKRPTSFFASPVHPSDLVGAECEVISFGGTIDPLDVLRTLAGEIKAPTNVDGAERKVLPLQSGALTPGAIWAALNHFMPEGSIVSDEAGMSSRGADEAMSIAARHDWLNLTGGSIGQALSVAAGASVARPGSKVFAMQGDGGGLYTLQALWTQAREQLDVVNVILNNGRYGILDYEAKRHGIELGSKGASLFDLGSPSVDWVALATGFGVRGVSASTAEEFNDHLREAIATPGPCLIDARLSRPPSRKR
jgi:acetolactate synthase-1/2/3 large subunit